MVEFPAAESRLDARFAAQVARHGERLAVSWPAGVGLRRWSYAELDRQARAVAEAILAAGGAGPVALLLGHDGPMIAGLLGVLQAGRAYVPLDPYAPRARNEWLLADAGAGALVTDEARLEQAPWLAECGLPIVVVDDGAERLSERRGGPTKANIVERRSTPPALGQPVLTAATKRSGSLAYLLYTSGTTGHPKGVAQTHAHVLGHIRSWTQQLRLTAEDRVALFSGYGYDAAVQDVFGALLNGASVHAIDLRGGETAPEIVDRIGRERLTVLHATPTVYRYLFGGRVTCEQDLSSVRLVVLGGEEARRSDSSCSSCALRAARAWSTGSG